MKSVHLSIIKYVKQDHFTPGTNIPIISEKRAKEMHKLIATVR